MRKSLQVVQHSKLALASATEVLVCPPLSATPNLPAEHQLSFHSFHQSEEEEEDADAADASLSQAVAPDLPISLSEDVKTYGDLIHRMTSQLVISTSQPPKIVDDVVFDVVQAQLSSAIAIPLM